jgi:hypothetical protein
MIPIYIAAFNRPFYLDRCIWSIKKYATNYSCIKVLDGGTPSKYQEKLMKLHPEVEMIVSLDDAWDFWMREVEKEGHPYLCGLQDDEWFIEPVDFAMIENRMRKYNLPAVKLIYGIEFLHGIDIKLVDYIEVYKPNFYYHLWQSWLMSMMVFLKEYWMIGFKANEHKLGKGWTEDSMVKAASDYILANDLNMGRFSVRKMCQGQAISSRTDKLARYGLLPQHLYLNAVNEFWYNDKLDITENFPKDFSTKYLESIFVEQGVPSQHIESWKQIRTSLLDEVNFLI